ncbi:beta-galactosidase 17, partial [Tanacetum coccineum]
PASSEIFRTRGDMSLTFKRCGNFDPFIAKTDATSTTYWKTSCQEMALLCFIWHMVELTLDFITVQDYPVDLTSYDYDAPISESGDVDRAKFKALRAVIAKYSASTLPPVPLNNEKTGYGRIKLEKTALFFDALDSDLSTEAIESENSISMEAAGQVHDRAQVYVTCLSEDKRAQPEYIGTIDRWSNKHVNLPNAECASSSRLLILVQDGFCAFHRNRQPKERCFIVGLWLLKNETLLKRPNMQKKEEEKRIAEEQAAKDRYWKIPICYDDDEDYAIATTPVSSTKEPDNSLNSDSFFEKSDTSLSYSDKSLPEFEPFSDDTEETRSGSTITHANNSLPEYDSFLFEIEPDQGELTNIVIEEVDTFLVLEDSIPPGIESNFYPGGGEINISQNVEDDDSFTFVIRTFLPFLTYPADSPSTESEDTIFDLGIST